MPLANALRARFPDAFVAWLVEKPASPLLENHPAIDELIVVPRGWLKDFRTVRYLRRRLRQLQFDVAIDPQSLTKSAIPAWLSGAKTRIGFAKPWGRELAPWLNNQQVNRTAPHVVDSMLQLLAPLGIESPRAEFRVPVDENAEASAAQFARANGIDNGLIVINTGAGWPSRLWPVERYAEVAVHMGAKQSMPSVVVWAGDQERAWAQEIVEGSKGHAVMAPPTSLPELASLLRRARLFVGSDTGPLHLAAAVGTPCVAMYGPTPTWQSGPYGDHHVALQEVYHKTINRKRRGAGNEAMRKIRVEMVCDACDRILRNQPTDRAA